MRLKGDILKEFAKRPAIRLRRFRKSLIRIIAALGIICGTFAIAVVVVAKIEDVEARKFTDGKALDIPLDRIGRATVNIWINNEFGGRGYLDAASKILITNFHVMKVICNETKSNPTDDLKCDRVNTTLRQDAPHLSGVRALLKVRSCSLWLDACVLDVEPESPLGENIEPLTSNLLSKRLILIPLTSDRRGSLVSVITGNALSSNRVLVATNLACRPGYSGSPVFTESGAFTGILKAATWSSGINLTPFLKIMGMRPSAMMRHRTFFISEQALRNVLFCPKDETIDCSLLELKTFSDQLVDVLLGEKIDLRSKSDILTTMNLFSTRFTTSSFGAKEPSPTIKEMLALSDASADMIFAALTKNGWLHDSDRLQEFVTLLAAKSSLKIDNDDGKRHIAILRRLKNGASVDTKFISKLIEFQESFIWGAVTTDLSRSSRQKSDKPTQ